MDPVTILGVVGNAVQLVDFTAKLISKTQSIQRTGSLVEQEDLLTVSKDLGRLSNTVKTSLEACRPNLTENDQATSNLCQKCLDVAHEIEQALSDIDKGPRGKWKSFRQALKAIWGAQKLADMQRRLDLFSQELQHRMHVKTQQSITELRVDVIHSIDSATTSSVQAHDATRDDIERLRKEAEQQATQLREEIRTLKTDIEKFIQDAVSRSERGNKVEQNRIKELTNATYILWATKEVMLTYIMDTLSMFRQNEQDLSSQKEVLRSMRVEPYPSPQLNGDTISRLRSKSLAFTGTSSSSNNNIQLWYPIAKGDLAMIEQCLEDGANVNEMITLLGTGYGVVVPRVTPLIAALLQHPARVDVVELLLMKGADPTACNSTGKSAFSHAVQTEDLRVIKALVSALYKTHDSNDPASISPDASSQDAESVRQPVSWKIAMAIIEGNDSELGELSFPSASVLETACLHLAVLFGNLHAVKALLSIGVFASKDHLVHTPPLVIALREGYIEVIHLMMVHSHDPRDLSWYTALYKHTPELHTDIRILETILNNTPQPEGLQYAISLGNTGWIKLFVGKILPILFNLQDDNIQGDGPKVLRVEDVRKELWTLVEIAFDMGINRMLIELIDIQYGGCYLGHMPVSFAKKIAKWIAKDKTDRYSLPTAKSVLEGYVTRIKGTRRN